MESSSLKKEQFWFYENYFTISRIILILRSILAILESCKPLVKLFFGDKLPRKKVSQGIFQYIYLDGHLLYPCCFLKASNVLIAEFIAL